MKKVIFTLLFTVSAFSMFAQTDESYKLYDVEKLNLNGEHNDPSIIRSKLCWDIFNEIGMTACRAAFKQ